MAPVNARAQSIALEYFFSAVGIYACFLSWGVLQERISTTPYPRSSPVANDADVSPFRDFVFLNLLLSLTASIVGFLYVRLKHVLPPLLWRLSRLFSLRGNSHAHAHAHNSNSNSNGNSNSNSNSNHASQPLLQPGGDHPAAEQPQLANSLSSCSSSLPPKDGAQLVNRKASAAKPKNISVAAATSQGRSSSPEHQASPRSPRTPSFATHASNRDLWRRLLFVSLTSALASPFGYASLRHVDYPTMLLAKSCKLLPVLIASVLIHRRSFPPAQYLAVVLVSFGVSLFVLNNTKSSTRSPSPAASVGAKSGGGSTSSPLGIFLLICNLALDGLTNASQDAIFRTHKISAFQLMVYQNVLASAIMGLYLIMPTALLCAPWIPHGSLAAIGVELCSPAQAASWSLASSASGSGFLSSALTEALGFITTRWSVVPDLMLFALCGSLGQIFIFHTLSRFGSLSLVTITVTRKMFSIILSVVVYKHVVVPVQWIAVSLVFLGIVLEAYSKPRKGNSTATATSCTKAGQCSQNLVELESKDGNVLEKKHQLLLSSELNAHAEPTLSKKSQKKNN